MTAPHPVASQHDTESAISREAFREAMAQLASAVNVVTTAGPGGRAGFTASAVCSVTDTPPTLLVCLNQSASAWPAFADNEVLCVNVLGGDHEAVSNTFGGRTPMDERFEVGEWSSAVTGAPVLTGALAHFDCRITRRVSVGTHDVLFCEIVAMDHCERTRGLLYFDRGYHQLPRRSEAVRGLAQR
ncbi:flavin reductase [Kushneria sinocarnis]|uniref:FMN reductase (NADH) RutF n=1 Tax=Kushneria sinocarnis TaxID=595502 RepID=A0A420X1L1_9GAMM|nr:flavin reductase [Kushneria sinocarnis]RKR07589.1 flavin reductase [Kushneria sinocarnis]